MDEIEIVADGEGVALIGDASAIERFLAAAGLPSRDLGLPRLRRFLGKASVALEASVGVAQQSGRWVKLTEESARAMRAHGLMKGSAPGLKRAQVHGPGGFGQHLQIVQNPGALFTNPAVLSGAAGLMQQLSMQQTLEEIGDYLATIDAKVDDILRAQTDAALAELIGAGWLIDEALIMREDRGQVPEVTWSQVQGTALTIATGQAYALRRLEALADAVEQAPTIGALAEATRRAQAQVEEWLSVLGRCVQLGSALAVLELDRALEESPEELDVHRQALARARAHRLDQVSRCTLALLARLDEATDRANSKVLFHPTTSPSAAGASNDAAGRVREFSAVLGLDQAPQGQEVRRWSHAAVQVRDRALESGAKGAGVAKGLGQEALGRARAVSGTLADRARRRRDDASAEDHDSPSSPLPDMKREPTPATVVRLNPDKAPCPECGRRVGLTTSGSQPGVVVAHRDRRSGGDCTGAGRTVPTPPRAAGRSRTKPAAAGSGRTTPRRGGGDTAAEREQASRSYTDEWGGANSVRTVSGGLPSLGRRGRRS